MSSLLPPHTEKDSQVGHLWAAPGSLSEIEMDFMNHISNEKLPPFCSGDPWQPRLGSVQRERQGNRLCQTWSEPSSPSLCSRMCSHSRDDENPLWGRHLANTFQSRALEGPGLSGLLVMFWGLGVPGIWPGQGPGRGTLQR